MAEFNTILYEVTNNVAKITLNRPERRNAFNSEMISEVTQALKNIRRDNAVRATVITGAGKGFSAGQDLETRSGPRAPNQVFEHLTLRYKPLFELIHTIEKPFIAAVNGVAAGSGASLAMACDLCIMAENASMLQAFSNIGLVPDTGSTWFLVRQIGFRRAFEIAIEGERISAARCLELGLVNRVVPPEHLLTEAQAWAEKLAQRSLMSIGLTKRALNYAATHTLLETFEYESHLQQIASEGPDYAEGVSAFLQKRPPFFNKPL
jgi:2-(1,2-epoxy-1,2-dihydrophenyl)acetyl-CoA isomerase